MTKISKTIKALLKNEDWFDYFPKEINNGNCDSFAYDIEQLIEGSKTVWADMWIESISPDCSKIFEGLSLSHCFVEYNNRFYDAECPDGVNHPIQLPFFVNQNILS